MTKEERMRELLSEANETLLFYCNNPEGDKMRNKLIAFFEEEELEEIKYNFDIVLTGMNIEYFKKVIKERDEIELVRNYGIYDLTKSIIRRYWKNMYELFGKLEKIYLEEKKDNEQNA